MTEIFSPYLLAAGVAFVVGEVIKWVIAAIRTKRISTDAMFQSGGMPSTHTAATVALAVVIGARDGVGSSVFAVALLFALIVIIDAMRVRRATGENGVAIEQLIKKSGAKIKMPFRAHGHRPIEVLAGTVLGLVVGIVTALL